MKRNSALRCGIYLKSWGRNYAVVDRAISSNVLGDALSSGILSWNGAFAADNVSPSSEATSDEAALQVTTAKFNAYVRFMNRTLRAVDSLDRYKSWVSWKKGPTGRERLIYGLYSVYDTTDERAAATKALGAPPSLPDLDDAMRAYIAANDALAPILNEANGYYDRADYKEDHMAEGKRLHFRIVAAAEPFLAARAHLETVMRLEKGEVDKIRLATIEKREGRSADWHVANVMFDARRVLDTLEVGEKPVVMADFEATLNEFGGAVKDMDTYASAHPNAFFVFQSQPDGLLAKLRSLRDALVRTHGNLRRAGGFDMTWIMNDYNMMVTTSQTATRFNR